MQHPLNLVQRCLAFRTIGLGQLPRVKRIDIGETTIRICTAGRDDLADYLERFIPFYSGIKRWQVEFKEAHRDEFMTVIDPLCETLVRTVRGLGLALTDEEVESNWALIAVVEAKILPFLCLLQAGGKPDSGSS